MALTQPSSEHNPSRHHIQTAILNLAFISFALYCVALLAAPLSSSIMVLTTGSSPGAGQLMPLVAQQSSRAILTTLHIGVPKAGYSYTFVSLLLHEFASLAANCSCLVSKTTGVGESPNSHISAPHGVGGSTHRTDLACRLRGRARLSRQPTSWGSHQSLIPYSATTWIQASWTALNFSRTTTNVCVAVQRLAPGALAFFTYRLWFSLNTRCACFQKRSQNVASLLNCMN